MIQIYKEGKEKVYYAVCTEIIDVAQMLFLNLINDIIFAMKRQGATALLSQVLSNKRRDNHHMSRTEPSRMKKALCLTSNDTSQGTCEKGQ